MVPGKAAGNDNWTGSAGNVNAAYPAGLPAILAAAPGTFVVDDSLGAVIFWRDAIRQ